MVQANQQSIDRLQGYLDCLHEAELWEEPEPLSSPPMKNFDNLVLDVDQHSQVEPKISQPNHTQITVDLSWGESFEESY